MRTQIVDGQGSRTRTAQVCEVRFIEYCVRYQLVIASLLHLRCSVGMSSLDPHHMHMKLYPHFICFKRHRLVKAQAYVIPALRSPSRRRGKANTWKVWAECVFNPGAADHHHQRLQEAEGVDRS